LGADLNTREGYINKRFKKKIKKYKKIKVKRNTKALTRYEELIEEEMRLIRQQDMRERFRLQETVKKQVSE